MFLSDVVEEQRSIAQNNRHDHQSYVVREVQTNEVLGKYGTSDKPDILEAWS